MRKSRITENKPSWLLKIDKTHREKQENKEKFVNEFLFNTENLKLSKKKPDVFYINSFDVETTSYRNDFYLFGFINWFGEYEYSFSKSEAIKILSKNKNHRNLIYSTNLGFDFNSICEGTDFRNKCDILMRGNQYITINFFSNGVKQCMRDSVNYGGLSVESMGKILKKPKLLKPRCLGRHPKNKKEKEELILYNKRDCEITKEFMELVQKTVNSLGGELKSTISSSALDIFRRNFLKFDVIREKHFLGFEPRNKIYRAYYGGRTEVFTRGYTNEKLYYGDVNSLYPSVMLNEYPNPLSVQYRKDIGVNDYKVYLSYEGVSVFTLNIPYSKYPLLPYRENGKLIFPYGLLKDVSLTHLEVRRAVELYGEKIIVKMSDCLYYVDTKPFFKDYVESLYSLRKKYTSENSEMSIVIKLLLNGLYGRFALKNIQKNNFFSLEDYDEAHKILKECEDKGITLKLNSVNEAYYTEIEEYEGVTSFPIWSVYVTAYARIKLHKYILDYEPLYCDTDSVITRKEVKDSKELGELKLEKLVKELLLIKPKLYFLNDELKCKGVPIPKGIKGKNRIKKRILNNEEVKYRKFIKVKEGITRNIKVNSIITQIKRISLEDDKRLWKQKFNRNELQESEPICIN